MAGGTAGYDTTSSYDMTGGAGAQGRILFPATYDPNPVVAGGTTLFVDETRSALTGMSGSTITLADATGFGIGDEVLVIDVHGGTAGTYEFATVSGVAGNNVSLQGTLTNAFDPAADTVAVQVVPRFQTVTVENGGTLTAHGFDGTTGGIVAFRVDGKLDIQQGGLVTADGIGYSGGPAVTNNAHGVQGASHNGAPAASDTGNFGGGGGGQHIAGDWGLGGGGASHATTGADGHSTAYGTGRVGRAGAPYGTDDLGKLFMGSGGGSGGHDVDGTPWGESGAGGAGGGIVYIEAGDVDLDGSLVARGLGGGAAWGNAGNETGGGGGGAGGSLFVQVTDGGIHKGASHSLSITGGAGGAEISSHTLWGGAGGDGRSLFQFPSLDPTDPVIGSGTTYYADEVRAKVTGVGASSITVADAAGFAAGDEVLLISLQGAGAGAYEYATLSGVSGNTLSFAGALGNAYDPATDAMAVQVVPHYNTLTIEDDGTLTAHPFDGDTGGIVAFRVDGLLDVQEGGRITADGLGCLGGSKVPAMRTGSGTDGFQGNSSAGIGTQGAQAANGGAGGAGVMKASGGDVGGGGGGGSYGTLGQPGLDSFTHSANGLPGNLYGDKTLGQLYLGSGGGSAGADFDGDPPGESGAGGAGGGIVHIRAGDILLAGELSTQGAGGSAGWGNSGNETGGGGGGSGGSLLVEVATGELRRRGDAYGMTVAGGTGGADNTTGYLLDGGAGGDGRLRLVLPALDPTDPVVPTDRILYVDEVRARVTAAGANTLSVPDASEFGIGDEVLVIDLHGTSAGTHEFATITSIAGNTLSFAGLANTYDPATGTVAVQVVPHWNSLTVEDGAIVTAHAFDGETGGICAFQVDGLLDVQLGGLITAAALGYRGGTAVTDNQDGFQGESYDGTPTQDQAANFGAGGGGTLQAAGGDVGGGGGGGSYGTPGDPGSDSYTHSGGGLPGNIYGDATLSALLFGSGGGSGGHDIDGYPAGESGAGGLGGGIVHVRAGSVSLGGTISVQGGSGGEPWGNSGNEIGGGGGGAGGSLYIDAPGGVVMNLDGLPALLAGGGAGGRDFTGYVLDGGAGGEGRVYLTSGDPTLPGGILAFDNFEQDWGNDWRFVQKGTAGTMNFGLVPADVGGQQSTVLRDTSNCYTYDGPRLSGVQAYMNAHDVADCSYSGSLLGTDDDAIGVLFRYADDENHYRISWASQDQTPTGAPGGIVLQKVVGGVVTDLAPAVPKAYWSQRHQEWFDWKVNLEGDRIQVLIDDQVLFDVHDDSHATGKLGVWAWGSSGSHFDNLVVRETPQFAPPPPPPPGLRGFYGGELFSDDFSGDLSAWTIVDAASAIGSSNWQVLDEALVDDSNVYSMTDHFGSIALAGDAAWTNYLFSGLMGGTDDDGFGAIFRYQDEENFYRLLWTNDFTCDDAGVYGWSAAAGLRLDKIIGGDLVPLAYTWRPYIRNYAHAFQIEAIGDLIAVWLDGELVFEVTDAGTPLTHGAIGLFNLGTSGLACDEIRVIQGLGQMPEPGSLALLGLGLLAIVRRRRTTQRRVARAS